MPTCGGFRIGVLISEPKTPPLVMVKVPPFRSSSVSVPSPARFAKSRIASSMSAKRHRVGVAEHRHDQAALGADRHADVVVVLVDDLVALDLGVDRREGLERADRRLDEERGDAEADAVLLLEAPPCGARAASITAVMSTSLKVVSMAAVCCASTRRRAMVARRLVMRSRVSLRAPARARRGLRRRRLRGRLLVVAACRGRGAARLASRRASPHAGRPAWSREVRSRARTRSSRRGPWRRSGRSAWR